MFGPAKKMMARLRLRTKFIVIGCLIFSLFIVVLGFTLKGIQQSISLAKEEARGVPYALSLKNLAAEIQLDRGMSGALLAGNGALDADRRLLREKINKHWNDLIALDKEKYADYGLSAQLNQLRDTWNGLQEKQSLNAEQSFDLHSLLIDHVLTFLSKVGDASTLTLDPDLDTYYLMDMLIFKLPDYLEALAKVRGMAVSGISDMTFEAGERASVSVYEQFSRAAYAKVVVNRDKVLAATPALATKLTAPFDEMENRHNAAISYLQQKLMGEKLQTDADQILSHMSPALNHGVELIDTVGRVLLERLQDRIDALQGQRNLFAITAVVVLLAVLYLAVGMSLAVEESVSALVTCGRRMMAGDVSSRVQPTSRDEFATIGEAFNALAQRLSEVLRAVKDSADQLATQAQSLSEVSAEIQSATGFQTEAASSMAASVEQMSVSIDQVTEHSSDALRLSRESGDLSTDGDRIVQDAAHEMELISTSAQQLTDIVQALGNRSEQIGKIVHVIQEIANQTNLLALNAAIEAARAGEQGRGFSVVADEVRKLAERTSTSTQEISSMVLAIQDGTQQAVGFMAQWSLRVGEGVDKARGASATMQRIRNGSTQVVTAVNEITSALTEQQSASTQIAQNVEKIAQMSEENAAAVRSMADSAQSLEEVAKELMQKMAFFKVTEAS